MATATATATASPKQLFYEISCELSKHIDHDFILSTKTEKGNTQISERFIIQKIGAILDSMGLSYVEAGSQQSKDFRDVGKTGLNIEVKKTDSASIYFNDTCPCKEYKRTPEKNISPQLLFINGEEFTKDAPWLENYISEINALKDKFARGPNKKGLSGIMEVYPRPTFKANISSLLKGAAD